LSYTKSIITGNAKRTAAIDNKAIERRGKLFVKLMGVGVLMSGGIIDIRFEITTPYTVRNAPMIM